MKRFKISGVIFSTHGTLIFRDRSIKKVKRTLKKNKSKHYGVIYVKSLRKGKCENWIRKPLDINAEHIKTRKRKL